MWILYLDFMRDQWPCIEEVKHLEQRYADLNFLSTPYKSACTHLLDVQGSRPQDSGPYKRVKT